MTMSVPGPKHGSSPPAAFVSTTTFAPSRPNSSTGWTTSPGALPSYRWNRPWSIATGRPPRRPSRSRPTCPGAVAAGQPGSSANGIATGVLELVGEAAEPRSEHDPDLRHEVAAGAHGGLERVEARRLVGGGIGVDGSVTSRRVGPEPLRRTPGNAGLQSFVQGSTAGGPQASAGPTRVPTPGCRSRPAGLARGRRRNAVATGYRSARSDRPWLEVLDVISVPRSLAAPSGKTYVTNPGQVGQRCYPRDWGGGRRVHQLSHRCGQFVDNPDRSRAGQPPRANISILGRCSVAAARRSE